MSIGFFKFDVVPSVDQPLVLAHSTLNSNIKGRFYVRISDCKDISTADKGDEFFGVLDDSSGFGACLFITNLAVESNTLLLEHKLHVKGDSNIDGDLYVKGDSNIDGDLYVKRNISGNSPNATINLTAAHAALILAAGTSGSPVSLTAVPIILK